MRKLLLLTTILATPAFAADLPQRSVPVVPTYNPFYIGLEGGMGFTRDEGSLIASPGLAVGTPKQYPTAPSFGLALGYLNATSAIAWGGELFGDFNLSQQSLNCDSTGVCPMRSRNSFSLGEDLLIGITIGQVISASPGNIQPQNWKFPIAVPTSIMNNFMLLASVGGAQRTAGLCALDITGAEQCGSEWMGGLSAGLQARYMVAGQWDVAVKYHHNFYNHTFTPASSVPVLENTVQTKGEDVFKVGFNYHLPTF